MTVIRDEVEADKMVENNNFYFFVEKTTDEAIGLAVRRRRIEKKRTISQ